jgi:hypothetical protein
MEDDFNDFSELSAGNTSIGLRRCLAHVTAERDQLRAERDAATARAEAAEKEALDYIDYRNQAVISRNAMERRLEAAEAILAAMRGALELLLKCNALGVAIPWGRAVSALALTPASAGARLKAEALREAAKAASVHTGAKHWEFDEVHDFLLHEADRLTAEAEKEAANGR